MSVYRLTTVPGDFESLEQAVEKAVEESKDGKSVQIITTAELLDLNHAQGRVLPGHYERVQRISELMDASSWSLHPDYGCVLKTDVNSKDSANVIPVDSPRHRRPRP